MVAIKHRPSNCFYGGPGQLPMHKALKTSLGFRTDFPSCPQDSLTLPQDNFWRLLYNLAVNGRLMNLMLVHQLPAIGRNLCSQLGTGLLWQ